MDKPFGLCGELKGSFPFDWNTHYEKDGIFIDVRDAMLTVGFDKRSDEDSARRLVKRFLDTFNFVNRVKAMALLNHSWYSDGSRRTDIHLIGIPSETTFGDSSIIIRLDDGTVQILQFGPIAEQEQLIEISEADNILSEALGYYSDEVSESERPLYGVYKSLETITKHLGTNGRKKLGQLAGRDKRYVDDVMETAQSVRHSGSEDKRVLTDEECVERAKQLIEAYARSRRPSN